MENGSEKFTFSLDKKKILKVVTVGGVALAGWFVYSWLTGKSKSSAKSVKEEENTVQQKTLSTKADADINNSMRTDGGSDLLPGLRDSFFKSGEVLHKFEIKSDGRIDKKDLLLALTFIRRMSERHLAKLRRDFRSQRRKNYNEIEIYRQFIKEFEEQTEFLLAEASQRVFIDAGINQENFDYTVNYYASDEEVMAAVNSLGVAKKVKPPEGISKSALLDMLKFVARRREELAEVNEEPLDLGFLNARLEDDLFFEYSMEPEQLAALFDKLNCGEDPAFQEYLELINPR